MKVLIIEDDMGIQRVLTQGFQAKNVVADSAHDGKLALQMLSKTHYDSAIVDLMLPHVSGENVIKKIRDVGMPISILVLTALNKPETKARLLQMGADDFLSKPFSFEELYARVTAIFRRTQQGELTENITVKGLELIPEKRAVRRMEKEIFLRNKEYALLTFLMKNPNKIFSRQMLMENVWGYSTSVTFNTVDSHIFNLRTKIDKGFDHRYIKTIHGVGYMFVPPILHG